MISLGERRPSEAHIVLKELLRFFTEAKVRIHVNVNNTYVSHYLQIHEHAPYFVDALWDYTPVLKVYHPM